MKSGKLFNRIMTFVMLFTLISSSVGSSVEVLANEMDTLTSSVKVQEEEEVQEEPTFDSSEVEVEITSSTESDVSIQEEEQPNLPNAPPVVETVPSESVLDDNIIGDTLNFGGITDDGEQIVYSNVEPSKTRATGNSVGSLGKYYGGYLTSTAYITVGGEPAWCIQPHKPFPVNVTYAKQVYNDKGIYNILYYAKKWGWNQQNSKYVDVYVALNVYLGAPNFADHPAKLADANVAKLLEKARVKDAPYGKFSFNTKSQSATVKNSQQETDWFKPTTDGSGVTYKVTIPNATVKLVTSSGKTLGKGTHTLSQSENFKLVAPLSYGGTVKTDIPTNLYPQHALKFIPNDGYSQHLAKAGTATDPLKVTGLSAVFTKRTGNTQIVKTDADTGKVLQGAKFEYTVGGVKKTGTTNVNGIININNLVDGTVISGIKEVSPPTGYVLETTTKSSTVVAGKTNKVSFTNKKISGSVKLIKYGDKEVATENPNVLLPGAEFTIYDSANKALQVKTTDTKGELTFGGLEYGEYTIKETKTPVGYSPMTDLSVNITENGKVYEVKAVNNLVYTDVKILKLDKKDGKPLANATFKYVYNGKTFDTKSGTDGYATMTSVPHGASIVVTEIIAPTGYVLNAAPQTVIVDVNKVQELTFKNDRIVGSVKLVKYADKEVGTEKPNVLLPGAEFTIYDSANKALQTKVSDSKGELIFGGLEYGKYTIKETKTPVGFSTMADIPVNITQNGKVYEVKAVNNLKYTNLKILKLDSKDGKPLANATFKYVYNGKTFDTKSGSDGYAMISNVPHGASIVVTEIVAPTGYVLNTIPQTVIADVTKVQELTFKNDRIKGNVELIKYADENWTNGSLNKYLEGAEFSLFSPDGKILLGKATTDKNGKVTFKDIEYGFGYILKETKTPIGYEPVSDMKVDITEDGKTYQLTATDKVIRENVKLVKFDDESNLNILSQDARFEIKNLQTGLKLTNKDELGQESTIFTTNEVGEILLPQLPYGEYEISEVKAPWGYIQLTGPVKFFVDGTHNGLLTVRIGNKLAKGTVTMTKTGEKAVSSETQETEYGTLYHINYGQELLDNVTFEIYAREDVVTGDNKVQHQAGDLVATYTTNEEGQFTSTAMYVGSYYAKELAAPNGYIIKEDEIDFTIDYEGQEVELTSTSIEAENNWNEAKVIVNKLDENLAGYEENQIMLEEIASNDKVFGLFRRQAYTFNEEEVTPENALVGIATTIEGQAIFEGKYPDGDYYAKELNSGDSHVIIETEYPISLTPVDNREELEVSVFENATILNEVAVPEGEEGVTTEDSESALFTEEPGTEVEEENQESTETEEIKSILNKLFLTDVPFEKINETSKLEEGVGYIYDYNQLGEGAEFELKNSNDEVIQTVIIDAEGQGVWRDLIVGSYTFQETKTSNDTLVLDPTVYQIDVTQETTTITDLTDGSVVVEIDNVEEIVEESIETDVSEEEPTETEEAPEGTEPTEEVPTEETEVPGTEVEEETDVEEILEPVITLKNRAIRGKAELEKTDVSDGKKLPETGIEIKDEDGKTVVKGRTDKDGNFKFDELPKGKYTFREFDAPKGYIIDETPIPFEIKEDGDVIKCQMTNVKEADKLRQTKAMNEAALSILLTISSMGLFMSIIKKCDEDVLL